MSGLKYFCAIAVVVGMSSAAQAFTLTDGDAELSGTGSTAEDFEVNVTTGPGAGLPDYLDHADKVSFYLDGVDVDSSTSSTTVGVTWSLTSGGPFSYAATATATIVVTNTSGATASNTLSTVQDFTLTRFAQTGGFASGPSTENAVLSGLGDHTVTQTELGDNAGFLISKMVTTLVANEDIDNDGFVGDPDLNILLGNFGTQNAGGRSVGDIDGDGAVGDSDLNQLLSAFGSKAVSRFEVASDGGSEGRVTGGTPLSGATDTGVAGPNSGDDINSAFQLDVTLVPGQSRTFFLTNTVTPEPASLALLGLGATLLAARRSRRS